ncbi:MAG: flagellar export chaperone FliS [Planctomycetaceae bacterium]
MFSHDASSSGNESSAFRYLENAVRNASPPRLRLMLIERAVGLCQSISQRWKEQRPADGCDEQTLQLRDIMTELLAGVGKSDLPLALQVADLYVFLSQHLTSAEMSGDVSMIDEICLVLQTEAETWRLVCETTSRAATPANSAKPENPAAPRPAGLNLHG